MPRHPLSRNWKWPSAFLVAALVVGVFLWTQSYALGVGSLLATFVGLMMYLTGESSNLPGTAGDDDKNVPT